MDRVKHLLELRIALGGEEDTAAAPEHEGAVVFNATAVFDDLHFRVVSAHLDLARIASGEGLRHRIAVQSEPGRQFNRYRILFGPCIIEIDRVAALTGREERLLAVLKESWLQEETFAGALRVTRDAHVVAASERLDRVSHVLDANVREFGGAYSLLELLT